MPSIQELTKTAKKYPLPVILAGAAGIGLLVFLSRRGSGETGYMEEYVSAPTVNDDEYMSYDELMGEIGDMIKDALETNPYYPGEPTPDPGTGGGGGGGVVIPYYPPTQPTIPTQPVNPIPEIPATPTYNLPGVIIPQDANYSPAQMAVIEQYSKDYVSQGGATWERPAGLTGSGLQATFTPSGQVIFEPAQYMPTGAEVYEYVYEKPADTISEKGSLPKGGTSAEFYATLPKNTEVYGPSNEEFEASTKSSSKKSSSKKSSSSDLGKGAATGTQAKVNETRLKNDSNFVASEKARTDAVIKNRKAAGLDTSSQEAYKKRLNTGSW